MINGNFTRDMTSYDKRELPILDMKLLLGSEADVTKLVQIAEQSLKEVGFFVIKNHGIPDHTIKQTFGESTKI
jgi:isopenicillin N synthase-like dioxygenase